jgi:hypothetical protein
MICEIPDVDSSSRLLTAPAVGLVRPRPASSRPSRIFQQINTSNHTGSHRLVVPHYRKFPTPRPLLYRADRRFGSARMCLICLSALVFSAAVSDGPPMPGRHRSSSSDEFERGYYQVSRTLICWKDNEKSGTVPIVSRLGYN